MWKSIQQTITFSLYYMCLFSPFLLHFIFLYFILYSFLYLFLVLYVSFFFSSSSFYILFFYILFFIFSLYCMRFFIIFLLHFQLAVAFCCCISCWDLISGIGPLDIWSKLSVVPDHPCDRGHRTTPNCSFFISWENVWLGALYYRYEDFRAERQKNV